MDAETRRQLAYLQELIASVLAGAVPLSSALPQDVAASAVVGVGTSSSRDDHVHARGAVLDAVVAASHAALTLGVATNGLSLAAGQVLSLAAAGAAQAGAMTAGTQTIDGDKTFTGAVAVTGNLTVNTSAFKVDTATGRVGIGTSNPGGGYTGAGDMSLHILKANHNFLYVESLTASCDPGALFSGVTAHEDFCVFVDESDSRKVKFATGDLDTDASRVSNTRITLTQAGFVGIGITPTVALQVAGDVKVSGSTSAGHTATPQYPLDFGTTTGNTLIALYNNVPAAGTSVAGIGVQSGDMRFHLDLNTSKFSWRVSAAGASVMELTGAGALTVNSVAALTQTNTVAGITNKTFTSLTHSGTMALGTTTISGTPNFSGAATIGGVSFLSQTNTVAGITNKTFTSPTINAATFTGTLAMGTSALSGTPDFTGAATLSSSPILSANSRDDAEGLSFVPGGRLTLTSATSVTTADVTGATTVYYAFHGHDRIKLYNGTRWVWFTFAELSQLTTDATKSPAAVANNSVYDLFVWSDSGTLRCTRGPLWTSDTTRGTGAGTTELERLNGRWVNKIAITNGPAAQRGLYVGTIRSDGSAQINDSAAKRHVWNAYNRAPRGMRVAESTNSWTYNTNAFRQANAAATNQLDFVLGLNEDVVFAQVNALAATDAGSTQAGVAGVGLDSTAALATGFVSLSQTILHVGATAIGGFWRGHPGIGRHTLTWLENGTGAGGTTTWYGTAGAATTLQTAIHGEVFA